MKVDRETLQKNFASMSDKELLERHARGELTDLAFDVIEGELRSRGAQFEPRPNSDPDLSREADQTGTQTGLTGATIVVGAVIVGGCVGIIYALHILSNAERDATKIMSFIAIGAMLFMIKNLLQGMRGK
jgi:hypothetical protein